jgi:hypothetical protein
VPNHVVSSADTCGRAVELLVGQLEEILGVLLLAGVVDHGVDAVEGCDGVIHQLLGVLLLFGQVGDRDGGTDAGMATGGECLAACKSGSDIAVFAAVGGVL